MINRLYPLLFAAILILALAIRLIPLSNNNFYFTMDQGNDAVHVREILARGQIFLDGPETGIKGFYHGPLWYYFISIGYAATGGHPIGAVLMLILLNVAATAIIITKVAKEVNKTAALLIGTSLQFFWWFYDASRFAFNPFPLVALAIFLIFLLCDFLKGRPKSFVLAAIPVALSFHTESAAGVAFLIFYLSLATHEAIKRKLKPSILIVGLLVFSSFQIPKLLSETKSGFSQTNVIIREIQNPSGVFAQTRLQSLPDKFKEIIATGVIPQNEIAGIIVLAITLLLFLKTPKINQFTKIFFNLAALLTVISFIWFSTNRGWQVWHSVYIQPLAYISILLILAAIINSGSMLQKRAAFLILIATLLSQLFFFKDPYSQFLRPANDPSLLANELAAVDWVYQESQDQGFYVYSYLPSVEDYPYQYLFWWRGTQKYGYLPCEYSTAPGIPDFFVPGQKYYQTPKKPCTNLRFLIIEPDSRKDLQNVWLNQVQEGTILKETNFGSIRVEKRQL